ncbi:MAG: ABC transporter substrate-binding protein [Oscillospiraceae bacterium]
MAKAKELLAQAGYPDGFDMTISVPNNYQPHMDTAEVVAEQLREAGINVTIQPVEWSTWLDTIYNGHRCQAAVVAMGTAQMDRPGHAGAFFLRLRQELHQL